MNSWKNKGAYAPIAILMNPGAIWMGAAIRGCLKIAKVRSMACKTTPAMDAQVMFVLISAFSFVPAVEEVIAQTVWISLFPGIVLLKCASPAQIFQLANSVISTFVTFVAHWANVNRTLVGFLGCHPFAEYEGWGWAMFYFFINGCP